jgi:hypothetical protein
MAHVIAVWWLAALWCVDGTAVMCGHVRCMQVDLWYPPPRTARTADYTHLAASASLTFVPALYRNNGL